MNIFGRIAFYVKINFMPDFGEITLFKRKRLTGDKHIRLVIESYYFIKRPVLQFCLKIVHIRLGKLAYGFYANVIEASLIRLTYAKYKRNVIALLGIIKTQ